MVITPAEHDELFVWITTWESSCELRKISHAELNFLTIKFIQKQSPGDVL